LAGVAVPNAICNSSSPAAASRVRAVSVCWQAPVASAREQRMLLGDNTCVVAGGLVGRWRSRTGSATSSAPASLRVRSRSSAV